MNHIQTEILNHIKTHPKIKTTTLRKKFPLVPDATFFRYLKLLRLDGIITKDNKVVTGKEQLPKELFTFPNEILNGILPPKGYDYKWTHIAAYLSKYEMHEIIPGYDITKEKYLEQFKDFLDKNIVMMRKRVWEMQNTLAMCALYANELANFRNMQGTIQLPQEGE